MVAQEKKKREAICSFLVYIIYIFMTGPLSYENASLVQNSMKCNEDAERQTCKYDDYPIDTDSTSLVRFMIRKQ